MTSLAAPPSPIQEPVRLSEGNLREVIEGLPRIAEHALRFVLGMRYGALTIGLPNGRWVRVDGAEPGPEGTIIVRDLAATGRILKGGDNAFAEAYFDDAWDSPDLTAFLRVFFVNHDMIRELSERLVLVRLWDQIRHWFRRNTKRNARRNIHAHYDLGNAFFEAWLDRSMTYSSGLFDDENEDLTTAQKRKYEALAQRIGLKGGDSVLEIGCGWGGFAEYAAGEIGARVTGLTISPAQFDYARERMFRLGLNERVELKLQDYRDETGRYDRIASIEMIEAVGQKYWPAYFQRLGECLKPGGVAGIQSITIADEQFETYRVQPDFVQTYIFPGGMLPARGILENVGRDAGLTLRDEEAFGLSYARTLAEWRERFHAAWPNISKLGFDRRFKRLWTYYLSYCEAGFRAGNINVRQMAFAKD